MREYSRDQRTQLTAVRDTTLTFAHERVRNAHQDGRAADNRRGSTFETRAPSFWAAAVPSALMRLDFPTFERPENLFDAPGLTARSWGNCDASAGISSGLARHAWQMMSTQGLYSITCVGSNAARELTRSQEGRPWGTPLPFCSHARTLRHS